jgi:FRG domain
MKTYIVETFAEYHCVVWKHRPLHGGLMWIYRGQSKSEWTLVPKAGRVPYSSKNDLLRLNEWKQNAWPYIKDKPDSEWDWLALAQHYGFATRLLDWTYNPLIALYFCVTENEDSDGCVYMYMPEIYVDKSLDPIKFDGHDLIAGFKPPLIDIRIKSQSAMFTFHGIPKNEIIAKPLQQIPLEGDNLYKIDISKKAKQFIKIEIDMYGINDDLIFPGLEGVSKYMNRCTEGIRINNKYME